MPKKMTNYDVIISAGPRYLAQLTAEIQIETLKKLCEKIGVPFEDEDKLRAEMIIAKHEWLLKEVGE